MKYKNWKIKNFSFGFEIEGVFSTKIFEKLEFDEDGEFKADGSVQGLEENVFDSQADWQEYASGVFTDWLELKKTLKIFGKENFAWNQTCGLHFHLKAKGRKSKNDFLRFLAGNFDVIKKLQDFAKNNLCGCLRERLANNYFFRNYQAGREIIRSAESGDKYRFLRFHPSGTLEFRFLPPCEHKAENVRKMILYFLTLLNSKKNYKVGGKIEMAEITTGKIENVLDFKDYNTFSRRCYDLGKANATFIY